MTTNEEGESTKIEYFLLANNGYHVVIVISYLHLCYAYKQNILSTI